MRRTSLLTVLLAVLAGLLLMTGCSLQPNDHTLPGQKAVGSDGYTVTVLFEDVANLVPNSPVQLDDVIVGTVAAIEVRNWQARVRLRLSRSVPIPADATFTVGQKTLLGAQYVEIGEPARPTGTGVLADGDLVPATRSGGYPQTEQVLGAASLLLNNGGLSQISTITGQLTASLRDRVPDTRDLVTRLDQLLGVLDRNRHSVVAALEELRGLSADLAAQSGTVAHALRTVGPGLRALNRDRQSLISAVLRTGRLSTRAAGVVAVSEQAVLHNLDAIRPMLTRLGSVSSQLPEALKIAISVPFPAMTSEKAIRGDYANLFATLDLSLPTLLRNFGGARVPAAFQAGDPVRGPLAAVTAPPAGATPTGPVPATPSPTGSSPTPDPSTAKPAKPCGLLALLGAC